MKWLARFRRQRRPEAWHRIQFFRQMGVLIHAGIPALKALETCARQSGDPVLQSALREMADEIRAGSRLSEAMSVTRGSFSSLHAASLRSAERIGDLSSAFEQFAAWEERDLDVRRRLQTMAIYPTLLVVVSLVGTLLLVRFLLPLTQSLASQLGRPVPYPTQVLMGVGRLLDDPLSLGLALGSLAGATFVLRRILARPGLQAMVDRLRLGLPMLGGLARTSLTIRLGRTLAALMRAGLSLVHCLELAAEGCDNRYLRDTVLFPAADFVRRGESLAQAMGGHTVLPASFHGMLAIGESSGTVPAMLDRLSDLYELELDLRIESAMRLVEPVLVLLVGAMVLGVMLSAFLPLYDLLEGLGS